VYAPQYAEPQFIHPQRPMAIDYSGYPSDIQIDIRKRFYDKFLILQRSFPDWRVPLPSPDSPLESVHALYESYVKQISIHSSLTQYKIFLVVMFAAIEFASARFGVDLGGYAEHQIRGMGRYEGALLELGEKYSGGGGGEWPVEVRIMFIAVTQAVVFFIAKYIERWTGSSGISTMVHNAIDGMVNSIPMGSEGQKLDAQGIPIVPGTEEAISAVDQIVAEEAGRGSSFPKRASVGTPAIDLSSMLGGLFGGGSGMDMAGLVGSALKVVNGMQSKSSPAAPTIPNVPANKSPPGPSSVKSRTSPRSRPRAAPVFSE
jgi:hypothetical protein